MTYKAVVLTAAVAGTLAAQMTPEQARDQAREIARESARSARDYLRSGGHDYDGAIRLLERRQYDQALASFDAIALAKGERADGAMYWKAYTLGKLGRKQDGLNTLADLQRTYPSSRWLNDAKALEVELRASNGQPVKPDQETDDELKLMALNGLVMQQPDRAMPALEKILQGSASPKLKERTLFVLAQSGTPAAQDLLVKIARGTAGNPDVQLKAIELLGVFKGPKNTALLMDIYKSNPDPGARRRVLQGLMIAQDKQHLAEIARSETNLDLRRTAIQDLGVTGGQAELVQLYGSEQSTDIKQAILNGMVAGNNPGGLIQVARSEKDPQLKRAAVEKLSHMHSKEAQDYMIELLNKD